MNIGLAELQALSDETGRRKLADRYLDDQCDLEERATKMEVEAQSMLSEAAGLRERAAEAGKMYEIILNWKP